MMDEPGLLQIIFIL